MTLSRFIQMTVGCLRGTAIPLFAAFTLATISGFAFTQPDQGEFRSCRGIADNSARLACYDGITIADELAEYSTASPAPGPAPDAVTRTIDLPLSQAPVAAEAPAPGAMAGVSLRSFGIRPPRVESHPDADAELVDTVAAIEELSKGKVRITLSNGQIWKQSISKSFFLRERDTVRISRSPWGGTFRLHKDGKPGYIQVERLR